MVDFTSILNKPAEAVEKPKPKPIGSYQAVVTGMPAQRTVSTKDGDRAVIRFTYKLISAADDVDQDQLSEVADISTWPPLNHDVWIDGDGGDFQLVSHLENVLKIDKSGKSIGEMLAEAPGAQLLVTVKHRPFTRQGATEPEIATEVGSVAAL